MPKESVILTPNRRLTRHLQKQSCSIISKSNLTAWRSEKILPLTTWLANCWQECNDSRVLLDAHQERLVWLKVIEEVLGKVFDNIVDSVIKAHDLAAKWQLNNVDWSDSESEDVIIFKRLNKKFTEYCRKEKLISECQLPSLIIPYLQPHDLKITFADFDEYPPQLEKFIADLQKLGCEVIHYNSNEYKDSLHKRLSFSSQRDEVTTIARWAKQIIDRNPKAIIGVVVANLTELRSEIVRVFNEVLDDTKKINVSAGTIFSSLPIINNALELLALHEPFSLKTINKVLLSPYVGGAEIEKSTRALFDFQLSQLEQPHFRVSEIDFFAKKYSKKVPLLINILQKIQSTYAQVRNKKLYSSEWAKIFVQMLQIVGWPGENDLTDVESAAVNRFTELLNEFATTDVVLGKVSFIKAIQALHDLADHTVFQSEQETDVSINVLGVLETAGINFDHMWVMGLDQASWPTAPNPNPFIPIKIQKKFGLPRSSAQRELQFCEKLVKRFKSSAHEVVFSYVKQIEDRVVDPSFLIEDIPEIPIDDLDLAEFTTRANNIYCSKKMDVLVDNFSLPLMPNESINGGSRLLELQSLCPFRAFAEFRLAAKEFNKFEPGISKLKRGNLIHVALEMFWQDIKTHESLCSLDHVSLQELIKKSVSYALDNERLSKHLYSLEYKCLIRLLSNWLEVEKGRPGFEVIATEKTVQTVLGSVKIKLRVDRIDRLANGNLLLIDYKTGKNLPTIFDWFGKRPKNPQLPLYCVAVDDARGFAFAQINIDSIKFKDVSLGELSFGMQSIDECSFKDSLDWNELIVYWHEILTCLAKDFVLGYAQPEPLSLQVCKQCEFGILCRYV